MPQAEREETAFEITPSQLGIADLLRADQPEIERPPKCRAKDRLGNGTPEVPQGSWRLRQSDSVAEGSKIVDEGGGAVHPDSRPSFTTPVT